MVVLFVDIFSDEYSKKNYIIKSHNSIISIKFNKKMLNNIDNKSLYFKLKNKFIFSGIKKILKDKIINKDNISSCIFSKELEKESNYIKIILNQILNQNFENIYEAIEKNMIYDNLNNYIDRYIKDNNIKRCDVKILYIIDELNNDIYNDILENINKFKYIDVAYLGDCNSLEYTKIIKKIELINNELGCSIELINPKFDMDYNIYFNFSLCDFKNKYTINDKFLYIDCLKTEQDEFNKYNIAFKNNSYVLKVILKKLESNIENYNITKIGYLIVNNIIKC